MHNIQFTIKSLGYFVSEKRPVKLGIIIISIIIINIIISIIIVGNMLQKPFLKVKFRKEVFENILDLNYCITGTK